MNCLNLNKRRKSASSVLIMLYGISIWFKWIKTIFSCQAVHIMVNRWRLAHLGTNNIAFRILLGLPWCCSVSGKLFETWMDSMLFCKTDAMRNRIPWTTNYIFRNVDWSTWLPVIHWRRLARTKVGSCSFVKPITF